MAQRHNTTMSPLARLRFFLRITRSHTIARRYFVVNGFDGTLTLLGMITGFYFSNETQLDVLLHACLGAAIALGVSGFSSAYISEAAEREHELQKLESAMVKDLSDSAHGQAARTMPVVIALVNGLAPLCMALLVLGPLWLVPQLPVWPISAISTAMIMAFVLLFLLGVFLGQLRGSFWLFAGLRTLLIGVATCALIMLFST